MKTLHTALVAAAAITAAAIGLTAPATASAETHAVVRVDYGRGYDRDYGRGDRWNGGYGLDSRINQLEDRISMGLRTRQLSGREADRLYGRLHSIENTKRYYERSGRGLDSREVAMLNESLDRLSGEIRYQGRDGNRW